jgi:hypothetical protein
MGTSRANPQTAPVGRARLAVASLFVVPAADAKPDSAARRVRPFAPPAQEVEFVTSDGFDWGRAGIGAGTRPTALSAAAAAEAEETSRDASGQPLWVETTRR